MKKPLPLAAGATALLLSLPAAAQNAAAPVPEAPAQAAPSWLSYGGDLRIRHEAFDQLPAAAPLGDYWSYFRFRARAFMKAERDDFTFYLRAVNETRAMWDHHGGNSYPFPDELVFDQIYGEAKNLLDGKLRARVGRQDIMDLGSLRVLGEGTPGDGSRTFYFDAVRLTYTPVEKLDIDLVGAFNHYHDPLAVGKLKRDLNGNRSDESGAFAYVTDKRDASFVREGYYIWKHESGDARRGIGGNTGRDTHTFGLRLLPKFTDTLSAEFEAAGQLGRTYDERDIHAFMLYGGLAQTFDPLAGCVPYVSAGAIMLSGDADESEGKVTAWNPVWGRLPAFGDLSGMQFPGMSFWYQNMIYPHVEAGVKGAGKSLRLQTGPMFAQHVNGSDVPADFAGDGRYRGWHFLAQAAHPLIAKPAGPLKKLDARAEAGCLLPGDYFADSKPVYFLRLEVMASF